MTSKYMHQTPKPLFDTLDNIKETPPAAKRYLLSLNIPLAEKEHALCISFLESYANSPDTFAAYRREVERLLHWTYSVKKQSLKDLNRHDVREFLSFIQTPPKNWLGTKIVSRFSVQNGLRDANPDWRPFVVRISKRAHRNGKIPMKSQYQLSNKSLEAIFAILSSLFTFLQQEEYRESNPVALLRQKKAYLQRQQSQKVTRKLSRLQWLSVINTAEEMAKENPKHERTLFLMSAFYLLGLRISELSYAGDRMAIMGNFAPDKRGLWWYTTLGKGNKVRDVAVPDELLQALKRYRLSLDLSPLPARSEATPLFPKMKGKTGLGTRQIRNIVQIVFDAAVNRLQAENKGDEALDLATATVHWLRHTAISAEVEYRPREHIRDDVGHENPGTMDKYIDIDRIDRHRSAQLKPLRPIREEEPV